MQQHFGYSVYYHCRHRGVILIFPISYMTLEQTEKSIRIHCMSVQIKLKQKTNKERKKNTAENTVRTIQIYRSNIRQGKALATFVQMDTPSPNATVQHCLSLTSFVRSSPSQAFTINGIVACVVNAILAITATIVNALVILTFWKSPNLRTKAPFFLIMVLSLTDFAVGVLVHPMFIVMMIRQLTGRGDCISKTIYLAATTLFPGLSGATLTVINVERYLAIAHPFFYQRRVTKENLLVATLLSWSSWIPIIVTAFFNTKLENKLVIFYVTAMCLLTTLVYLRIYLIARQKRRLAPKPLTATTECCLQVKCSTVGLDSEPARNAADKREKLTEFIKDVKLAKTFVLIVVCSQVCYFPSVVYHVYLYLNKGAAVTMPLMIAGAWVLTFITINSTLNSLIFFWKNSQLRNEMLRIVRCG